MAVDTHTHKPTHAHTHTQRSGAEGSGEACSALQYSNKMSKSSGDLLRGFLNEQRKSFNTK